jgi:hypothetical protein
MREMRNVVRVIVKYATAREGYRESQNGLKSIISCPLLFGPWSALDAD